MRQNDAYWTLCTNNGEIKLFTAVPDSTLSKTISAAAACQRAVEFLPSDQRKLATNSNRCNFLKQRWGMSPQSSPVVYLYLLRKWKTKPYYALSVMAFNGIEWRVRSKWDTAVVVANMHSSLSHQVYSLIPAGVRDASGIWWNILLLLWESNWWVCLSPSLSPSPSHIKLSFKASAGYPSDYFACCYS